MADNLAIKSDASTTVGTVATDKVTYSGDTVDVGLARLVNVTGAEGSKTVGSLNYHVVAAASTNVANIKSSAGAVLGVHVSANLAEYPIFVKLHNTSGSPTAGAGVVKTIGAQAGQPSFWFSLAGLPFTTGIGISIVKGIADSDATAVAASDCVVDVEYV